MCLPRANLYWLLEQISGLHLKANFYSSQIYIQPRVHYFEQNVSLVIDSETLKQGMLCSSAMLVIKSYTPHFSFLDFKIDIDGQGIPYISKGDSMVCSTLAGNKSLTMGLDVVHTCQSSLMIMGDVHIKLERQSEPVYKSCFTDIVPDSSPAVQEPPPSQEVTPSPDQNPTDASTASNTNSSEPGIPGNHLSFAVETPNNNTDSTLQNSTPDSNTTDPEATPSSPANNSTGTDTTGEASVPENSTNSNATVETNTDAPLENSTTSNDTLDGAASSIRLTKDIPDPGNATTEVPAAPANYNTTEPESLTNTSTVEPNANSNENNDASTTPEPTPIPLRADFADPHQHQYTRLQHDASIASKLLDTSANSNSRYRIDKT